MSHWYLHLALALAAAACLSLPACKTTAPAGGKVASAEDAVPGGDRLILIGNVPSRYLEAGDGAAAAKQALASITIEGGVIRAIKRLTSEEAEALAAEPGALPLRVTEGGPYDVIYPGMINLHNHTKQNVLPVWGEAKGQFANRFEWRDWDNYTKAVSYNMNPWIDTLITTCAAFRWSELQAMVLGTTYLQGPSSCIAHFAIHQVEDPEAFRADDPGKRKSGVQAPTDLVVPADMPFVWKHLAPLVLEQGMTYEAALKSKIVEFCPRLVAENKIDDVNGGAELKIFADKAKLASLCDKDPDKFQRYLNWQHKTVAGKKKYLADPRHAAVVVHLAEGRRNDPYNKLEFTILKVFGLDQPNVNLVHAVGVDAAGYKHMAEKKMGMVWSPFSNFLLYGETADVKAARDAGVLIALGSDWTPTGSRGVLEELKVARAYVKKARLDEVFTDEVLYDMVTENPARMINHFEDDATDGRHDVGTIKVDAAASLVVIRSTAEDPYTSFVTAQTKDIDLVIIDGKPLYGEVSYLKKRDPAGELEKLPAYYTGINDLAQDSAVPRAAENLDAPGLLMHQESLAKYDKLKDMQPVNTCGFEKGFVRQDSSEGIVVDFRKATAVDLDKAGDIEKVLAMNLMTQSYNRRPANQKGDANFAVAKFPPLFGCNDGAYDQRLAKFIAPDGAADETGENTKNRAALRLQLKLGKVPANLAKLYGLSYDPAIDY